MRILKVAKVNLVLDWAHLVESSLCFIAKRGRSKKPDIAALQLDSNRTSTNRKEIEALEGSRIGHGLGITYGTKTRDSDAENVTTEGVICTKGHI